MTEDSQLLSQFADQGNQAAFRSWVEQRLPLVYSAALRMLNGDRQLAEDVAQQVFADAAERASELASHSSVAGWLFTSTRFAATKLIRSQSRRVLRELTSAMDPSLKPNPIDWEKVRPVIDEALADLPAADRDAVIQRFFDHADFQTIARNLDLSPNAARMRVDRALDKLSSLLARRGIRSTGAALGTVLGANSIVAAPAGLASSIASSAITATTSSTLTTLLGFISTQKVPLSLSIAVLTVGSFSLAMNAQEGRAPVQSSSSLERVSPKNKTPAKAPTEAQFSEITTENLARNAEALREELQRLDAAISAKSTRPKPAGHIYKLPELDKKPVVSNQTRPRFPAELKKQGISGRAIISFTVDASGWVHDLQTVEATHPEFAESALAAIAAWRFSPGEIGDAPVNTRMKVPMEFTLNQNKAKTDVWF